MSTITIKVAPDGSVSVDIASNKPVSLTNNNENINKYKDPYAVPSAVHNASPYASPYGSYTAPWNPYPYTASYGAPWNPKKCSWCNNIDCSCIKKRHLEQELSDAYHQKSKL